MSVEIVGGKYIPSAQELAANAAIVQQQAQAEKDKVAEAKARDSAIAKLKKLGLTLDEAEAITG